MKYLKALLPSHNQLLIELSFLIGIIFLGASFASQNANSFFIGLGILFYSLYVFEMSLFKEKKADQEKVSVVLFFFIALSVLLFLIFFSYPRIIEPWVGVPFSKNWLIHTLVVFFIIDFIFLVMYLRKSRVATAPSTAHAPKTHALRTPPKATPKEEAMQASKHLPKPTPPKKHKTPRQLFSIFLFCIGIIISIFMLAAAEWFTLILTLVVMAASLYFYRLTTPAEQKLPEKAPAKVPLWQKLLNTLGIKIKKKTAEQKLPEKAPAKAPAEPIAASSSTAHAPKTHALRTPPKATPKEEAMQASKHLPKPTPPKKHKTPRQLFSIFLFCIGIIISIFMLAAAEWFTLILTLVVMAASLYFYRLTTPAEQKLPEKAPAKVPLWQKLLNTLGIKIKKKTFTPVEIELQQSKDIIVKGVASYETDFDRLYALVQEKKVVKAHEISQKFGISLKKAEEWVKILESSNLIEITYPPFGEFTVKIKDNDQSH